jgi:hypothetical protein
VDTVGDEQRWVGEDEHVREGNHFASAEGHFNHARHPANSFFLTFLPVFQSAFGWKQGFFPPSPVRPPGDRATIRACASS